MPTRCNNEQIKGLNNRLQNGGKPDLTLASLEPATPFSHESRREDAFAMMLARCVTDNRMIICDHDETFPELIRRSSSTLLGSSIYDLTHPDDLATNRRLLDSLRNEGKSFCINKRYVREDGEIAWVTNHVSRIAGSSQSTKILATVQLIDNPRMATSSNLTLMAERILETRKTRSTIFEDRIFGEPDYEIILDLFVNEQRGRSVSVSSSCIAACVPPTTALRHVARLETLGWIERVADAHDKRRSNLALTSRGFVRVTRYLEECIRTRPLS